MAESAKSYDQMTDAEYYKSCMQDIKDSERRAVKKADDMERRAEELRDVIRSFQKILCDDCLKKVVVL